MAATADTTTKSDQKPEVPWHAAYPPPRLNTPPSISHAEVLQLLRDGKRVGRDLILIDLRRTDHEGGTIRGSLNLPAQSLYPTIPTLYTVLSAARIEKVIWYCGSSRGRGNRAAGWFHDYIEDQKDPYMKSLTLVDGIKGWQNAGEEYIQLMDEYQEHVWLK
ncbi:MAG: hypothetical protein M1836_008170 [Candelina mexicana]|nr:MAG: hypothetical protein M1836_008170 [Candelina mexicana]